jgi:hypothetical protein
MKLAGRKATLRPADGSLNAAVVVVDDLAAVEVAVVRGVWLAAGLAAELHPASATTIARTALVEQRRIDHIGAPTRYP